MIAAFQKQADGSHRLELGDWLNQLGIEFAQYKVSLSDAAHLSNCSRS